MILFPAIDILGGKCVRLERGDLTKPTIYNSDPLSQAREFESLGFEWLHVVDLDGAVHGKSINHSSIESILRATKLPVQIGGGVRDLPSIEYWTKRGAARVILGTVALVERDLVRTACERYPGRIAVSIDALNGQVATDGWKKVTNVSAVTLAQELKDLGISAIIYTDIGRDGVMKGINIEATLELVRAVDTPIIASGGLSSIADLQRLLSEDCKQLTGVIVGRAIYDGKIDVPEALSLVRRAREAM